MGFESCSTCGHIFTKNDGDIPHADGGFMEVNHGGGVCLPCYLKAGHWLCSCGQLGFSRLKYCAACGKTQEDAHA